MKPNETGIEKPDRIEWHPTPTLRSQLITTVRLFTIAAVLMLVLWYVDRVVNS